MAFTTRGNPMTLLVVSRNGKVLVSVSVSESTVCLDTSGKGTGSDE